MKDAIRKVLDKYSDTQLNLASDVAREILTDQIYEEILLYDKTGDKEVDANNNWLDENDETSDCGGV